MVPIVARSISVHFSMTAQVGRYRVWLWAIKIAFPLPFRTPRAYFSKGPFSYLSKQTVVARHAEL